MRGFFFELREGLLSAFRSVGNNKLRSLLTTLGIVIGIVTITVMVAVINSIESGFDDMMSQLGTDVIYVQKWPAVPDFSRMWEYWNRPPITDDLIDVIQERSRYASAVAPVARTGGSASYHGQTIFDINIIGSTADYPRIRTVNLENGRFYSELEERSARAVAVVGYEIAEKLYPSQQALGKSFRLRGHKFRVIGVMESTGGNDGTDKTVRLPYSTFKSRFGGERSIEILIKAPDPQMVAPTKDEVTGIVRVARGLEPAEENNFEITEQTSIKEQLGVIRMVIYGVGLFLTALALLVGGIGVMNIMFVSVKERTREIGLRKAVGAPRRAILVQFLLESVIICSLGGAIGTMLAYGGSALLNVALDASITFSVATVLVAMGLCAGVGIIFGLAPAWSATKAEPVEALRYE